MEKLPQARLLGTLVPMNSPPNSHFMRDKKLLSNHNTPRSQHYASFSWKFDSQTTHGPNRITLHTNAYVCHSRPIDCVAPMALFSVRIHSEMDQTRWKVFLGRKGTSPVPEHINSASIRSRKNLRWLIMYQRHIVAGAIIHSMKGRLGHVEGADWLPGNHRIGNKSARTRANIQYL